MVLLETFQKQFFNYWVVMNKMIMKSLSTKEKPCGEELYLQCLARKVNERAKNIYNCNLYPLLPHNTAIDTCPNQVVQSLLIIWSTAIASLDEFEECLNIQPCLQVIYSTRGNTEKVKVPNGGNGGIKGPGGPNRNARAPEKSPWQLNGESIMYLSFENNLVQVIEDQYVYSIMGIISEIGGAVGILVGMSVMTIVEYFLMLQKKAALLRRHFQENTNIVRPITPTEVLDIEDQNKKAKTPGDTLQTNFPVARKGSMIPTLSNNLGRTL